MGRESGIEADRMGWAYEFANGLPRRRMLEPSVRLEAWGCG